jgi:hypothetical protein
MDFCDVPGGRRWLAVSMTAAIHAFTRERACRRTPRCDRELDVIASYRWQVLLMCALGHGASASLGDSAVGMASTSLTSVSNGAPLNCQPQIVNRTACRAQVVGGRGYSAPINRKVPCMAQGARL